MCVHTPPASSVFFFNDTATTEIYTLSLHDALPISQDVHACEHRDRDDAAADLGFVPPGDGPRERHGGRRWNGRHRVTRSEEHTSELQSRLHLVCRLLLEKKKKKKGIQSRSTYLSI